MLYELLVGAVPFDSMSLRKAGLAELLRVIREEEAPPLPAKLTRMGKTAEQVADRRHTDPVTLRRQLAGDLNWIVLKAVEKTRRRRYGSVADLAADVRRHLEDRPVLASPPSRTYRLRKFVKRHRVGVLAGTAVASALILGVAGTAWEARVARRERADALAQKSLAERHSQQAAAERARSERHAEDALHQKSIAEERLGDVRALANSMLFEVDDQVRDLPGSTMARETLARLGMQYLNKVSEQAAGDTGLQQQLGAAYLRVGDLEAGPGHPNVRDLDSARRSYRQSVAILEEQLRADRHNPELRHLLTLGYLRNAQLDESEEGRKIGIARARQMAEKLAVEEPANLQAQSDLAETLLTDHRFMGCARCGLPLEDVRQAVAIRKRILEKNGHSAQARWALALAQSALGKSLYTDAPPEALEIQDQSLRSFQELTRQEPANVQYQRDRANALYQSAWTLISLSRYDEAKQRSREAVATMERVADGDPLNADLRLNLVDLYLGLGAILFNAGETAGVMENLTKALAMQSRQAEARPHNADLRRQIARIRNWMGNLAYGSADNNASLAHYREAESIYRSLIREHPGEKAYLRDLAAQLPLVADRMAATGNSAGALPVYRESVDLWEKLGGKSGAEDEDRFGLAEARASLARGLDGLGRKDEAIAENLEAIALFDHLPAGDGKRSEIQRSRAGTYSQLSGVYRSRGDWKAAIEASLQALPFQEADYLARFKNTGAMHTLCATHQSLRMDYTRVGDYTRGIEAGLKCVEVAEKYVAAMPEDLEGLRLLGGSYNDLGITYRLAGRRAESLAAYRKVIALREKAPIEKMTLASHRLLAANQLLNVSIGFRAWNSRRMPFRCAARQCRCAGSLGA